MKIDFFEIFSNPKKYETPEYYIENMENYRYYNPVLKTKMDIADNAYPTSLIINFFEHRMQILNADGLELVHSNIDKIIETAISYERTELTVYFMEYKKTHNLYTVPDWEL